MSAALFDFVPVWTLILGAGIFYYVLFDGFDLGVGMLYGFMPDARSRTTVMNTIAPVWDGNETWLVLGGVGLLAAFPLAFAIIIPALYFPIAVMLLALVFRGVAFEFRFRDAEHKTFWDHGFFYGSLIATLAQGMMLGAFIQGFKVEGRAFAGGPLDFLTPFSVLTGIALVFGYGLLGAGWLVAAIVLALKPQVLKTEDDIQARARRYGRVCLAGVVIGIVVVSLWTPLASDAVFSRWFSWPNILILSPVPIATALVAWATWRALDGPSQAGGFIGAVCLFALSYIGITISLFPMIVPHHFTLTQAASPPGTQAFLLVGDHLVGGTAEGLKVRADVGYH